MQNKMDSMTYHIVTFGCQMNKHDSEKIAGMLSTMGYSYSDALENSRVIVFNTCSVRENAAGRLYGNLNALKPLKKKEPDKVIMVGGCLAQNDKDHVLKKAPHVDIVFGTQNLTRIPELLNDHFHKKAAIVAVQDQSVENLLHIESVRAEKMRAWLPVTIGCDNFCSYCIVPYVRGRERSLPMEELLEASKKLAEDGVAEITLLGQNVNSYGSDIYGRPKFAELLKRMSELPLKRIRFTTSHPKDFDNATIRAMQSKNVCKHLHLPVQSGSDSILSAMNRKYTRTEYMSKVKAVRDALGDVSITTDIIVGYPGESDRDFEETLSLVEECQYDSAFTFIYSPREGTKAYKQEDNISASAKSERFERLVKLQNAISHQRNQRYLAKDLEVVVEGRSKKDKDYLSARTDDNKLVHFKGDPQLIDKFITVNIHAAQTWYLQGQLKG